MSLDGRRGDGVAARTLGLIGFGTIARQLVAAVPARRVRWVALVRDGWHLALPANVGTVTELEALIDARPAAVIEAAGQQAVAAFVPALLDAGIPTIVASVGALSDAALAGRLSQASRGSGAALVLPSGALGGLDYLRAIAPLDDVRVRYTLRKPPAAWADVLAARGLSAETDAVTLFEGTPAEAARLYPKNLNAAFSVAMAVGIDKVTVRVIADPHAAGNMHEIEAASAAGTAAFSFVNAPSPDNPKTSALTALSLVAALRELLAGDDL